MEFEGVPIDPSYDAHFIRICPNPRCHLVTQPDPLCYPNAGRYCPKCGTPYDLPPPWQYMGDFAW